MDDNKHNTSDNSVLLYNTQNIDAEVLKSGFSIRKREYDRIWKDIQNSDMTHPETHYLIQGVRGAGKTTLLSRLAYEVAADEKLSEWLVPILLNEEEYGILSLFTFWLRIAEKLAEQNPNLYADLFEQISNLDDSAEAAWDLIQNSLDENKQKIIVFVDNLGELFKDFDEIEHAQLRKVLSLHSQIRLVGGSSQLLEAHFDVSEPFYQFFKLVNLRPINEMEMHELLRSLAKQTSEDAVNTIEEVITEHPERIEAVRRLTDGVPRTIVLLFQIIIEGAKESSYAYLEETIDKTTPLYKHRMDDLSRQQKAIVHVIAMNWDAMSTKEIAEQTRLPSKTVSAQLVKLQQQWIVDKIETNTKNHLYIVKERFFNIWYLMRYGNQKDKRRVLWLTRFLESWYDYYEINSNFFELMKSIVLKKNIPLDYINAHLSSRNIPNSSKDMIVSLLKEEDIEEENIIKDYLSIYQEDNLTKDFFELYENKRIFHYIDLLMSQKKSENINSIVMAARLSKEFNIDSALYNDLIMRAKILSEKEDRLVELGFLLFVNEINDKKYIIEDIISHYGTEDSIESVFEKSILKLLLLWCNKFEKAKLKEADLSSLKHMGLIQDYVILLLAKGQVETAYNIFSNSDFRKEFKPIYYATVSLLKDERQQEYLRMGSELQGTVDEILQKVEEYRIKYD
ncbi:hypothetical protein ACFPZK_06935 [Psychrobacter urativorans]|uniref:MarR family transcriptional regulator n=1 Tax=Psychrobacter urativorans TaxID=45610 RepID=UPI001919D5B5|nr:DNA/RNA helicase domain-containing protein [Psychrobacter urativorans]